MKFIAADDKCFVFRSKDLRPEAKNFKIFFVHTVSNYSFAFVICQRSFAVAGPKAWNSLPSELRCIAVGSTFRRRLKAELFSRVYGVSDNT